MAAPESQSEADDTGAPRERLSRRSFFAVLATAAAGGLAACSNVQGEDPEAARRRSSIFNPLIRPSHSGGQ